jgi:hypothetical protein
MGVFLSLNKPTALFRSTFIYKKYLKIYFIFYQFFSYFLFFNNLFLVSFLSLFFVIQNKALHLTTE